MIRSNAEEHIALVVLLRKVLPVSLYQFVRVVAPGECLATKMFTHTRTNDLNAIPFLTQAKTEIAVLAIPRAEALIETIKLIPHRSLHSSAIELYIVIPFACVCILSPELYSLLARNSDRRIHKTRQQLFIATGENHCIVVEKNN